MATIKMNRAKSTAAAISYALGANRMKQETKDWLIEHGCPPDALKGMIGQLSGAALTSVQPMLMPK